MHSLSFSCLVRRALPLAAAASLLTAPVFGAASERPLPGYVDLGTFSPPADGGEFVEVNIPRNLLALAARIVGQEEPAVADLIRGLHSVRVNVVSLDDTNRTELTKRAEQLRERLTAENWQQIVHVRERAESVSVFTKVRDDGVIEGVTITVLEDKGEAVFVNIVGDINPDQIATLAERLDIEPLKKLPLKKSATAS